MPQLRESGPYIYPTWLTKLIAGLDSRKTGESHSRPGLRGKVQHLKQKTRSQNDLAEPRQLCPIMGENCETPRAENRLRYS